MAANILEKILATKRAEVAAAAKVRPMAMVQSAARAADPPRDFFAAIAQCPSPPALIAEIKKASPSAGLIRADFNPTAIAQTYEKAGASALSVLTDEPWFQCHLSYISAVKTVTGLPVLRKDFLIDSYQVYQSREAGADAILLIAAAISDHQIEEFSDIANNLNMTSLIEVHDESELRRVTPLLKIGRRNLLGINNRDLAAQRIDLTTTARLGALAPKGIPIVAESGIQIRSDVMAMIDAGASALLIGETLLRSQDIAAKINELFAPS